MFARSVAVSFCATLLIAMVTNVHAENWPNWRGPAASGVSSETGLPVTWSDGENIAWKAQFRGLGVSSPIVWSDRVFVTSQLGGGATSASAGIQIATFLVTAFLAANGKQLWEFQLLRALRFLDHPV
jgi:hypothetical protein